MKYHVQTNGKNTECKSLADAKRCMRESARNGDPTMTMFVNVPQRVMGGTATVPNTMIAQTDRTAGVVVVHNEKRYGKMAGDERTVAQMKPYWRSRR